MWKEELASYNGDCQLSKHTTKYASTKVDVQQNNE